MASTYSTNLGIEMPANGDQSGTWGTTVNTNLGTLIEQAISGYVGQAITDGADTTITIPNGATGVARNMFLELTGALTGARNLIVPANKKLYFIYNNTTGGYAVTVKVSGQTGVSVAAGSKVVLVSNGTDIVNATGYLLTTGGTVTGTLNLSGTNNVTGALNITGTQTNTGAVNLSGTSTIAAAGALNISGTATIADGKLVLSGLTSGASTLKAPAIASTYTHTLPAATVTLAGLSFAQTWSAKQTFLGSSSVMAMAIENAVEPATVSATAATGTINYDVSSQSIIYYTSSAAANWTVNFRHSSGTSLDTAMATGDILTVTFAVTQGSTAYYNSAVQVDGNSVTPKYGGGTAWSSGTASGIDSYTYTIIKTGSAAFTVLVDRRTFA